MEPVEQPKQSWQQYMNSPQYELLVNIIGIFNIVSIVVREVEIEETTTYILGWMAIQIAINFLFLIEIICNFVVHGIKKSYE